MKRKGLVKGEYLITPETNKKLEYLLQRQGIRQSKAELISILLTDQIEFHYNRKKKAQGAGDVFRKPDTPPEDDREPDTPPEDDREPDNLTVNLAFCALYKNADPIGDLIRAHLAKDDRQAMSILKGIQADCDKAGQTSFADFLKAVKSKIESLKKASHK